MRASAGTWGRIGPFVLLSVTGPVRPVIAQAPAGSTFEVSGSTLFERKHTPSVALTPSGEFVVVWNWVKQYETTQGEVLAQRFMSDGQRRGAEFQVNT